RGVALLRRRHLRQRRVRVPGRRAHPVVRRVGRTTQRDRRLTRFLGTGSHELYLCPAAALPILVLLRGGSLRGVGSRARFHREAPHGATRMRVATVWLGI